MARGKRSNGNHQPRQPLLSSCVSDRRATAPPPGRHAVDRHSNVAFLHGSVQDDKPARRKVGGRRARQQQQQQVQEELDIDGDVVRLFQWPQTHGGGMKGAGRNARTGGKGRRLSTTSADGSEGGADCRRDVVQRGRQHSKHGCRKTAAITNQREHASPPSAFTLAARSSLSPNVWVLRHHLLNLLEQASLAVDALASGAGADSFRLEPEPMDWQPEAEIPVRIVTDLAELRGYHNANVVPAPAPVPVPFPVLALALTSASVPAPTPASSPAAPAWSYRSRGEEAALAAGSALTDALESSVRPARPAARRWRETRAKSDDL